MRRTILNIFSFIILLLATSCWLVDDTVEPVPEQQQYQAITMLRADFENTTILEAPKTLEITGKIYVKDNYLFINQPNQGFHIFDNSDPSNPINLSFLKVLGSSELSSKNNTLYINNATDLIALTITPENNTLNITKRVINAFPELTAPDFSYHYTAENEVIINWVLLE